MSEWQPIATAPKDGTAILLYVPGNIYVGRYSVSETTEHGKVLAHNEGWRFSDYLLNWYGPIEPTHWMPLPAPPEERNGL